MKTAVEVSSRITPPLIDSRSRVELAASPIRGKGSVSGRRQQVTNQDVFIKNRSPPQNAISLAQKQPNIID
jgi:hypothetical protein